MTAYKQAKTAFEAIAATPTTGRVGKPSREPAQGRYDLG